MMDSFEN